MKSKAKSTEPDKTKKGQSHSVAAAAKPGPTAGRKRRRKRASKSDSDELSDGAAEDAAWEVWRFMMSVVFAHLFARAVGATSRCEHVHPGLTT